MVRARAIAHGGKDASPKARQLAERMSRLSSMQVYVLEREEAPHQVFRWVAGGGRETAQRLRVDLVLHLRRSIERPLHGWLEERHLTAALRALEEARRAARRDGGKVPEARDVPLDVYQAVIEGARKQKGARARRPAEAVAIEEIAVNEDAAPEGGGDGGGAGADGGEEKQAVPRMSAERFQLLRGLSEVFREAIAAGDMAVAKAISEVIARMCRRG